MGVKRSRSSVKKTNSKDSDAKKRKLYKSGQNLMGSDYCIATFLTGESCNATRICAQVPYCKKHMDNGDPSLKVVKHPKYGKTLVAARDLPARYHMGLYGARKSKAEMSEENMNWAFETAECGFIDPHGYEAQVKYCQCPGPTEIVTVGFSQLKELITKKAKLGSMLFMTKRDIPKNHQLVMMYAEDEKSTNSFFKERGIVRKDVGTDKYPCFRKASRRK